MGLGGISIWQLLIVLGIVVVIFGTGKLRGIGGDLGGAIKSFRKAMTEGGDAEESAESEDKPAPKLEADPLESSDTTHDTGDKASKKQTEGAASGEASR